MASPRCVLAALVIYVTAVGPARADGVFLQQRDVNGELLSHRSAALTGWVLGGVHLNVPENRVVLVDLDRTVGFDLKLHRTFEIGHATGDFRWARGSAFVTAYCDTVEMHRPDGVVAWEHEYEPGFIGGGVMYDSYGDQGGVSVGPGGDVAVAGNIGACEFVDYGYESWAESPTPIRLLVLSPAGDPKWEYLYDDPALLLAGIRFAPDGRLAVRYWQPNGGRSGLDVFDEEGERLWRVEPADFTPLTMLFDASGSMFLTGAGLDDDSLMKGFDEYGEEAWSLALTARGDSLWPARAFEESDSIVLAGGFSSTEQEGVFVSEVSKQGETIWTVRKGLFSVGVVLTAVERDEAGSLIAGFTTPLGEDERTGPFFWRFSNQGDFLWGLDRENHGLDVGQEVSDIAADQDGNIWIAGTYASDDEEKEKGCGC